MFPVVAQLGEHVGGKLDQPRRALLAHPFQMGGAATAQAAPHRRFGLVHGRGDPPVPESVRLVHQRCSDDLGGIGAAWLQRGRQHDVGSAAVSAARPVRAHGDRVRARAADGAFAPVAPFGQRPRTARAPHSVAGQELGGVLWVSDHDHGSSLGSRLTSVDYHTWAGKGPVGVGRNRFGHHGVIDGADGQRGAARPSGFGRASQARVLRSGHPRSWARW